MKTPRPEREYLRAFYRGNRLLWAGTMVATMLVALMANPMGSWLLKEAFDMISARDIDRLWELVTITAVYLGAFAVVVPLQLRLQSLFVKRALQQYKAYAFSRLTQKSISAFSKENTSRYISVLTADIKTIEEKYMIAGFSIVEYALMVLACGAMVFWYGGILAWICIILSFVPMILAILMGGELSRRTQAVSDQNERFVARIKDLLTGFPVLKSFKAEKQAQVLFDESSLKTEQMKFQNDWWGSLLGFMQTYCGLALQMGVVFAGGYLTIQGEITPGVAIIMINLCGQLVGPIGALPRACASWKAARDLVGKMARIGEENAAQSGETIPPVLEDAITMENLSFGYEEGKPVLKNVDLRFEQGKKYAIVGASGSGKTTLLNLLMGGFQGYDGSIQIDGKELKYIHPDSLYDLMSLIGQNVFLFDSTIRENITMFRPFPAAEVTSAAERSGLAAVIAAKGEDYRCGENGNGLSGGERQRVSIARALLRNTPVLMLDEATAALDNQTAFEVTDAILHLDGLTRIVVTHRLEEGLLRQYDEIFVLRDGRIMEQGDFETLMAGTGYFYSLYNVTNESIKTG